MPDFLTSRFNAVKRRINFFVISSLVFAVGFILGVIFNLKSGVKNPSYPGVEEFVKTVTNPKSNVFGVEIKFFLNCALISCLIFASTLSLYALPVGFAVLLVRGTVFGSSAVVFVHFYKLNGLFLFLIVSLIQTALTVAAYAAVLTVNSDCDTSDKCKKSDNLFLYKCVTALLCVAVCLVAALYGLIVIALIIKPICTIF